MNTDTILFVLTLVIVALGIYCVVAKPSKRENLSNLADNAAPIKTSVTCKKSTACTPENNCFPGSYLRSQVYQNMCEPTDTPHLLRNKVQVRDNCLRSLGNPLNTQNLECKVNVQDQRKCSWQK